MKKQNKMHKPNIKLVRVKTGTVEDFFSSVKKVMQSADKGKKIKERYATLTVVFR